MYKFPAPELHAVEGRNWLLHRHYTRKEFGICKILIQEELERTQGKHEYANYIQVAINNIWRKKIFLDQNCQCLMYIYSQGLVLRQEGKIQESLECFRMCHNLNPKSVDNIKQVARSL